MSTWIPRTRSRRASSTLDEPLVFIFMSILSLPPNFWISPTLPTQPTQAPRLGLSTFSFSVQPLPRRTGGPIRVAGSTGVSQTSSFASRRSHWILDTRVRLGVAGKSLLAWTTSGKRKDTYRYLAALTDRAAWDHDASSLGQTSDFCTEEFAPSATALRLLV